MKHRFEIAQGRNGFVETSEVEHDGDGGDGDLVHQIVRGVSRHYPAVFLLVLLGAVAGILAGWVQPSRFVSNAKLLLRFGAREQITSESLVDFEERQRASPPTLVDELQMLSDVAIFERVAMELGPEKILRPGDPALDDGTTASAPLPLLHRIQALGARWATSHEDVSELNAPQRLRAATKILVENTTVANEPGSNVILVSHTSSSPERAREANRALTSAFIERHREQFSIHSLVEKSRERIGQARQTRDEAATAYIDNLNRGGFAQLDSQVRRLEHAITGLENDLFSTRVRLEEITRLTASLSDRLKGIPSVIEIGAPALMITNEEYETQLSLKRTLLTQKQALLVENRPSEEMSRRDRELDKQIAQIEEKLRQTPKTVMQGSEWETQENLGHFAIETRIADLQAEDGSLVVKAGLLEARLNEKQTVMADLQRQLLIATTQRKDLEGARDAEQNRYAHLLERFSVLEALEIIDINEDANLRVLQAPTLEERIVAPKRLSLLVKGVIGGIFAAFAYVLLRQRFDQKLRDPEVFEHARGVPVLGIVPYQRSLRRMPSRMAQENAS